MAERVAVLPVDSGLFVLRYAATTSVAAPKVFVRASPSSEKSIRLVAAPGWEDCVLSKVGDCLVVSALGPSSLHVTLSATADDGGLDASIRLEKLMGARIGSEMTRRKVATPSVGVEISKPSADSIRGAGPPREGFDDAALRFRCLAHVARRGDQVFAAGEWIGGPTTPMRIEGIQLEWNALPGLQIHYQVLLAGARGKWSEPVSENRFAGSRGRALPLVGVRLRLVGVEAQNFELKADALFLGSSIESETGAAVEFTSRTGNDPLVGLRLSITKRDRATRYAVLEPREQNQEVARKDDEADGENAKQSARTLAAGLPPPDERLGPAVTGAEVKRRGRVRIFHARRTQDGPVGAAASVTRV